MTTVKNFKVGDKVRLKEKDRHWSGLLVDGIWTITAISWQRATLQKTRMGTVVDLSEIVHVR